MRTLGVDLAAEPKSTAIALLDWHAHGAALTNLQVGTHDREIVELADSVEKIGIDCALGWPKEFVDFIAAHHGGQSAEHRPSGNKDWRSRLAYRETDRVVREITGRWPLSVSTDRLAHTAMRAAGLMARLDEAGHDVNRTGSGKIAEVYPALGLKRWGLHRQGYRTSEALREEILSQLNAEVPWLELDPHMSSLVISCDAFDSLIAALMARVGAMGSNLPPSDQQLALAESEGWIVVPEVALSGLLNSY